MKKIVYKVFLIFMLFISCSMLASCNLINAIEAQNIKIEDKVGNKDTLKKTPSKQGMNKDSHKSNMIKPDHVIK